MVHKTYFEMTVFDWLLFLGASSLHYTSFSATVSQLDGLSGYLTGMFFSLLVGSLLASFAWIIWGNRRSGPNGLTTSALGLYLVIGSAGMMDVAANNAALQMSL